MKENIDFSIVIPSYYGSKILQNNLPILFEILNRHSKKHEVIIVNDGSPDADEVRLISNQFNCKFITYEINKGKGYAVRCGVKEAEGNYIIFTDTDIPFKESAFERMINSLIGNQFDVVIGDRTLETSEYFEVISTSRKIGSKIFTLLVTKLITGGLADTQCGFKGFKNKIAKDLFSVSRVNSFAFDVEILYIALKRKYSIKRIPVELRNSEESTVSLMKHAPKMLKDILSLKINHSLGRYKKNKNE